MDAYPLVERGSNVVVTDATPAFEPLGGALVVQNWNARSILAGVNDACDCPCGTQAAPLEVARASTWEPLILHPLGRMTWEPASVSGGCWFNVYRGVLSRLRSGDHGQCVAADLPFGEATDPSPPPAGDGWFYLVAGESDSGEGPLGPDSLGRPRGLTSACP